MKIKNKTSSKLNIAIIGAGFTGLAAAHRLAKKGFEVEVFESDTVPGGLANGFKAEGWDWPLEKHYHHLFVSDRSIRQLAKEVGVKINFTRPVTSTYYDGKIYQLDSPMSLLKFKRLPFIDRVRTGFGLALLKFNPFWKLFEKITAKKYITAVMGKLSWEVIWEPLFRGKFANRANDISASWFWARIFKRSEKLGYPEEGFDYFIGQIATACQKMGVKIHYSTPVTKVEQAGVGGNIHTQLGKVYLFDAIICTLPSVFFTKITPSLPEDYCRFITTPSGVGAVNLVLSLKQKFLSKGVYWLNINDRTMPYLAVVEHTNFIDKGRYGGDRLLYIGNYLPDTHEYFSLTSKQLLDRFVPHLKKINPDFSTSWVKDSWIWKVPFAQPVITPNYSHQIPPLNTPISNVYLANIQQVYPWDRGTNYAVELGQKVADLIVNNKINN